MKTVNVSSIINEILIILEQNNIINESSLTSTKLILEMSLSKYQLVDQDETAISTDVDNTKFYFDQFILSMKLRGCTEKSIKAYATDLKNFLVYIDKPVPEIKYYDIQKYLAYGKIQRGWADRTYNAKVIIIRTFFSFLYEEDMIADNPGKKLKEAKVEHRIGPTVNPYQREEIKYACKTEKEVALCEMLYSTGVRISELCSLNISDINFQTKTAVVYGKGRREREIYFTDQAKLHLQRYLETRTDDNPALFVTSRKPYNRMSQDSARMLLKKIQSRDKDIADITLTPHVYRRSIGTDMINKGAPLELVAEKLGHVNIETTKKCYASISRTTVKQAHEKFVS